MAIGDDGLDEHEAGIVQLEEERVDALPEEEGEWKAEVANSNGVVEENTDSIHISNLPGDVTEKGLESLFKDAGKIAEVKIYQSHRSSSMEADIVLVDPTIARDIIKWFNGYVYKGSKIRITLGRQSVSPPRDETRDLSQTGGRARRYEPYPAGGRNYHRGRDSRINGVKRNNPNVAPREGDWICSEPTCGNLNFARRTMCNNCRRPKRDMSPYPPLAPPGFRDRPPFLEGPPAAPPRDFAPERYRRPFNEFVPPRPFADRPFYPHQEMRMRNGFDQYERERFDRERLPFERGEFYREREREYYDGRRVHVYRDERRPLSPLVQDRDFRERSRSPGRRERYKPEWQPYEHSRIGEYRRGLVRRDHREGPARNGR